MAGSEICSILISTGHQKFGVGYQTVNDLYPDWILKKISNINQENVETPLTGDYQFGSSHSSLRTRMQTFVEGLCVITFQYGILMNCLVVDC